MNEFGMQAHTSALEVLWWVSFGITVITLVLIIYSMVRDAPFAAQRSGKITLFFAMGLLPLGSLYFTDKTLFDSMKEVEFCGSCHIMNPFVESLNDLDSGGLAALHVQHARIREAACYTCHTDYDMLGGVKGKIRGMRHLVNNYIKSEKERPKLYEPYPNGNCFSCHMQSSTWIVVAEHKDNFDELVSEDLSCLECHGPSHPVKE